MAALGRSSILCLLRPAVCVYGILLESSFHSTSSPSPVFSLHLYYSPNSLWLHRRFLLCLYHLSSFLSSHSVLIFLTCSFYVICRLRLGRAGESSCAFLSFEYCTIFSLIYFCGSWLLLRTLPTIINKAQNEREGREGKQGERERKGGRKRE